MDLRGLIAIAAFAVVFVAAAASGQGAEVSLVRPTSVASERLRLAALVGDTANLDAFLVRSPSLLLRRPGTRAWHASLVLPDVEVTNNSAIPYAPNSGALWAGRGLSWRATSGAVVSRGRFRAVLAPDVWFASNDPFPFTGQLGLYVNKPIPEARYGNGFANIWYVRPYSADYPWRNGGTSMLRFWAGQSGVWYDAGPVEFGATSENMWWGPGIRNALVMSDNAAGVPRLELRTPHPIRTRVGAFEARWFVGALYESQYFDTTKADDRRSLAAAVVTWRPSVQPNLTVGVTRAVFATAPRYAVIATRWLDVFANTGRPANHPAADSSLTPGGRDQLFSLFGRWLFPADGFEAYGEWARQELPLSLHSFLTAPTHSQGYTIGLQYRQPVPLTRAAYRLQFEATNLEPSGAARDEPEGVFYTSRRVIQGYTQFGKIIGAAIGPGASSQWLALDRIWPRASAGVTLTRVRWDEGVRAARVWPGYLGDCNQDVSVLPGIRGGGRLPWGYLSATIQGGTRFNYHFQNVSGCFGQSRVDVHNTTVSIAFSPATW